MGEVKLTKSELRSQQHRLNQLLQYLPTLQLKKALLQTVVTEARHEIIFLTQEFEQTRNSVAEFSGLFSLNTGYTIEDLVKIDTVEKRYENIAGADVPYYVNVLFHPRQYDLFDSPPWQDMVVDYAKELIRRKIKVIIAHEKKTILEKELREVTIRVNLFEKILIPRCERNIKKIKIFLGDIQLAAVCQAKVAKAKILKHARGSSCALM